MKIIGKLYYFLGSFYFAILLIATTALFVIAGTFLESLTDSHRYAAAFTYSNPLFKALLWGFFINILISALRRWPFKRHHIPFLITHWGMLMILAGVLIKSYMGTQGSMGIMEGSASREIYIPDSYVLHIEAKESSNGKPKVVNDLSLHAPGQSGVIDAGIPGGSLKLELIKYATNSHERLETWVKQNKVYISGLKPFEIFAWTNDISTIPVGSKVKIGPLQDAILDLYGVTTHEVSPAASKVYSQSATLIVRDTSTEALLFRGELNKLLQQENSLPAGINKIELKFDWSEIEGFHDPHLVVQGIHNNQQYQVLVHLSGKNALLNFNALHWGQGKAPVTIDIHMSPTLCFIQDDHDDVFLFVYDRAGRVYSQAFRHDNLQTFIEYDQGYGGYAVQAKLPPLTDIASRSDLEQAYIDLLSKELQQSLMADVQLSPPLRLLKSVCHKNGEDFVQSCFAFLTEWNKHQGWLYPQDGQLSSGLSRLMANLDWKEMPPAIYKGCLWCSLLFEKLEPMLNDGEDLIGSLQKLRWPLVPQLKQARAQIGPCRPYEYPQLLTALTQQIFTAAEQLPDAPDVAHNNISNVRLLSAYFRAYMLHMDPILMGLEEPNPLQMKTGQHPLEIECPVTTHHRILPSIKKLEDNLPVVLLRASDGAKVENLCLGYDRFGSGFKWPMLQSKYLVRFQPRFEKIPYKVRVRQARQINYAGSQQPFSYECDLIVTDARDGKSEEKTISMNNVHETWDGYRFYLSNITPPEDGQVKRVQIVVNHDPAKYYLTYPGAFIMTLGIILLFWMDPYKKRRKE